MKFKFGFEKLLEHYHRQEEIAQRNYNEGLNHLEAEKVKYKSMWDMHDDAHAEIFKLRGSEAGAPIGKLITLDQFIDGQKVRLSRQREVVINHTAIVEQKQEILIAAVKERKTVEKLKEKKLKEFRKLQAKRELKANDELVVMRFKRGEGS